MIHVNKERLGDFIGSERKNLGLTQRDLAARLHVTDKAVSKWERGLSYPDVTLLEPLAAALDLTVEELMACRRQAAKGAEETMQSLLDISRMLRIASSMTYVVLAISSASSFEEQFLASSPSDMRADESSGPSPSCSSFEKRERVFSSVRSTAVRMRRLSS